MNAMNKGYQKFKTLTCFICTFFYPYHQLEINYETDRISYHPGGISGRRVGNGLHEI